MVNDFLDPVEMAMRLADSGIDLSDDQFDTLMPHLVPLRRVGWKLGPREVRGWVFAERESLVLGSDDDGEMFMVGNVDTDYGISSATSFTSLEEAIREFLADDSARYRHG